MANLKRTEDPRLTRVSALCLALPETARANMGDHAAFTVRGKKFVYFLNDHHGDGIVSVCTRAFPGESTKLIEAHPGKFCSPAYIGPRGWVGLRLDRGTVDWDEVQDLLTASYLQVAPKKLAEKVEAALE
ncbi:MAG TPA: MmcQ/YjbR family DNA-binding protein [Acidobacteriaceae bacterium]|jgi:phosphoribosylglycinamide formyltransferase-1|nr:MmcQ/YjbR family DNA-binding protein [Acidobacteriaceae bacterium]